ncbi:MAG: ABC transporter substrate-binding protein [bacterium]|nr:ABC transporter substrate-binding protein [bacterium]
MRSQLAKLFLAIAAQSGYRWVLQGANFHGVGMRRRDFLAGGLSVAAGVSRAAAQPAAAMRRLAIFSVFEPAALMQEKSENRYYRALFAELRRLGYVEGQNLSIERYGKEKTVSGPAAMVAEVVRQNPDVVYVLGPGGLLFKRETTTLPIVAMTGDPVALGLVQSLARPGGNITGVSVDTGPSIHGKRIALLREIVPAMSKLAFLAAKATTQADWEVAQLGAVRAAAEAARVDFAVAAVELPTSEAAYRDAIAQVARDGANAVMVGDSPDTMINRHLIANLIGATGLPAIYPFSDFVEAGGLIAYSYDLVELNKRVANIIDAILRGTNAGEIPYYQATNFEMSINQKTAMALGLTVPATLLATADNVIE